MRDYETEWLNICNGIAESVLDATEEELNEEIRAEGSDPDEEAVKVRRILLKVTTKKHIDRCPVCARVAPKGVPGPAPIPRQYYCLAHRHLQPPRRDYA